MEHFSVSKAYKDEEGREWGSVADVYDTEIWVCLSDPMNPDLFAPGPYPESSVWVPDTEHINIAPEKEFPVFIIIIILVVVVVAATVLIRKFWKPNKAAQETKQ